LSEFNRLTSKHRHALRAQQVSRLKKPSFRNLAASSFFILAILIPGCGGGGLGLLDLFGPSSHSGCGAIPALPNPQGLSKVRHIIVLIQENRSFDNYFGALPYAPNTPYHSGPCTSTDNTCVDGLTCTPNGSGDITCTNSNPDPNSTPVTAFHDPRLCVQPDLDHSWTGVHAEFNFADPNNSLNGMNDGFVAQNDATEQPDSSAAPDDTMGFYTQTDLPYYYALANTFAIDDRYFSPAPAPTIPNRMYELAGTSFGHVVTTGEQSPPIGFAQYGYQPINGTIYDLLDSEKTCWREYIEDGITDTDNAYGFMFRDPATTENFMTLDDFTAQARSGDLPEVAFLDLNSVNNEHPPDDVREGEARVAGLIAAVRNGPAWKTSVILLTWDEGGGFYDHVTPPAATPPDAIPPGMCADNSNPPGSQTPGNGAQCSGSATEAAKLCGMAMNGETCAGFNQYGIRLPFVIISPFAKPGFVSHIVDDHTSILALIENRFLLDKRLTARDTNANDLEDMLDFVNSPSLHLKVAAGMAPPAQSSDPGCAGVTMAMKRARRP
jgi:phospholipase C